MASELTQDCCKPAPPCQDHAVLGKELTLGGLSVYVTGSESASEAIIFIPDIFGWKETLLRKLADKFAASGYLVVVPDFLNGNAFVPKAGPNDLTGLMDWLTHHSPAAAVPALKALVEDLKRKNINSFGVQSFCWGGKVAALAGKESGLFNAIVQAHPSLIEASDYEEVKSALLVLAASADGLEKMEPILAARKDIKSLVKIVPGVFHGWTCRYNDRDSEQVKNAEKAHTEMLDWFAQFVPTSSSAQAVSSNIEL